MGRKENLCIADGNVIGKATMLWKTCRTLKRLKIELLYDPGIPLLGIYPKEMKSYLEKVSIPTWSLQHYSQ